MAETDSLTGRPNRRKAMADLAELFATAKGESVLLILDLDGFKAYNDSFGHPAGDALLMRLGQRLEAAVAGSGTAYRLGGDEFCVLARGGEPERAAFVVTAAAALSEHGEAFSISASYGSVTIPSEAPDPAQAMQLADQRMYACKHSSRPSALSQSKDVLLQVLAERHPDLSGHLSNVSGLCVALAEKLELPDDDIRVLRSAAELHDIGKVAIPDAIVGKPGPLDAEEWSFIRRHTVVGQRIVGAAPVLSGVGDLIRSSHEAWNGTGYPDSLARDDIPFGARIIAVGDSFDAMTSERPYRAAMQPADALAELRRCAGTQFDPVVVDAFDAVMQEEAGAASASGEVAAARLA